MVSKCSSVTFSNLTVKTSKLGAKCANFRRSLSSAVRLWTHSGRDKLQKAGRGNLSETRLQTACGATPRPTTVVRKDNGERGRVQIYSAVTQNEVICRAWIEVFCPSGLERRNSDDAKGATTLWDGPAGIVMRGSNDISERSEMVFGETE